MRKLKLQMNMTIDGFVGDVNGGLEWMIPEVDPKHKEYLDALTKSIDTIILGRKMATEAIPYWEKVASGQQQGPEYEFANVFVQTPKVIFSKSVRSFVGKNVAIEGGDLKATVNKLKSNGEKDILVYGGANFAASLPEQHLVDELNLFVHPVSLGKGLAIFKNPLKFELVASHPYTNGIVLNKYKPIV